MDLTATSMLRSSKSFIIGKSSSKLELTFTYFSSWLSELLVIDLIWYLILFHSSIYFFGVSLLSSLGASIKYLSPLVFFFNVSVYFIDSKL